MSTLSDLFDSNVKTNLTLNYQLKLKKNLNPFLFHIPPYTHVVMHTSDFSFPFVLLFFSGVVEPEEIEHARIMDIGKTYLGKLHGQYTDWTPLIRRNLLFPEKIDEKDPWQFQNFRVQ
jgi:hypothetical protein